MKNDFELLDDGRVRIRLRRRSGEDLWTFILAEDLHLAQNISGTWQPQKSGRNWYAQFNCKKKVDGKKKSVAHMLHCTILGVTPSRTSPVDHEDCNGLNNCRWNLSVVTAQKNSFRRRCRLRSKSQYRNVYWLKEKGKWAVYFNYCGKRYYFGYFINKEEANIVASRERAKFI